MKECPSIGLRRGWKNGKWQTGQVCRMRALLFYADAETEQKIPTFDCQGKT
jgi:hypothetical protein